MGSLTSSGQSSGLKPLGSISDYLNQQGPAGIAGDLGSAASLGSSLGLLPSIAGPIGLGVGALSSLVPMLMGAFSGRPKMEATQDIASGANAYSDPIIRLLGSGASALSGSGTPISSPDAGSTFGPAFDAARRLEDIVRWGPGGASDPHAQQLDAQTLQNALHELGNPGKSGNSTLQALQNAWNQYQEKNPQGSQGWQTLLELQNQLSPAEGSLIGQALSGQIGGGSSTPSVTGSSNPLQSVLSAAPALLSAGAMVQNPIQPIKLPDQGDNQKLAEALSKMKIQDQKKNFLQQLLGMNQ